MAKFMKDLSGKKQTIDHHYGPRLDSDGKSVMVGDKTLTFGNDGALVIGGTRNAPTEGLYELLFRLQPKYTEDDLATYKSILFSTNAHKGNYKFLGSVNRNKSAKYTLIIKKPFPPKGSGLGWKSHKYRDISHQDIPNELVDRLRSIVISTESGHNSHGNVILNIVEKLWETGYIRGAVNNSFKSLLL